MYATDPSDKPAVPAPGRSAPPDDPAHRPAPVDIAEESIAGEEDPGAALDDLVDVPAAPAPQKKP
jgi:hypothetical protein